MINVHIDPDSVRKTQEKLRKKMELAVKRDKIRGYLQPGAQLGLQEAKSLVPVDTGELRDSLTIRKSGFALTVGSNKPHAAWNEFKNKPYLRPVITGKKDEIVEAVRQEYKKNVIT